MPNQWFRSWHGAPTDPKWLAIGRKCDLAPGMVFAIVWTLMDRASQSNDRGSFAGYDADEIAAFMGCDEEDVRNVVQIMAHKGMVENDTFTAWEKRQPKREDNSSERVKAHRQRVKQQRNAYETQCNAPDKEKDTDKNSPNGEIKRPSARSVFPQEQFDEFWNAYGNKVKIKDARAAFVKALKVATFGEIIAGVRRYHASRPKFIAHPTTWLNGERWNDEATANQSTGPPPRQNDIAAAFGLNPDFSEQTVIDHEP